MASRRLPKLLDAGARAPDFRLERLEGGETALAQLSAAGPALLAFFKITCPVCQMTLPFLERIHRGGTLPIYGISQDDAEDTGGFLRQFGLTFPMLLDREESGYPASNAYGISSVPTIFVVERGGKVSRAIEGWQKSEMERLGELAGVAVFRKDDRVPALKPG